MLWRLRAFPDFCEPCLPSPAAKPPARAGWLHEIKHDGFRMLLRRDGDAVRLLTRMGATGVRRHRVQADRLVLPLGRSRHWLKMKNPNAPAVMREPEEDWGKGGPDDARERSDVALFAIGSALTLSLLFIAFLVLPANLYPGPSSVISSVISWIRSLGLF